MAAEKNNKTLNVPNLRFPEFDGEWERCKVKDFTKVVAGATPSTSNKEYWGGDIRWMNSGELNLKRVYEVQGRITQLGYEKTSTKIIPLQSVLIGLAGQGKTRGTAAINYVELCTNQSIASILPSDKYYPEFLYQNIESRYKELRDISSGDGGRGGLNLQMIYNLTIPYCSLSEQKKIGKFLCLLDQRIETQKKVIEDFKKLKDAISKSLFSRHDLLETKVQISQIGSLKNGYAFQSSSYDSSGEYEIITIANVSGERNIYTEECNRIHTLPSDLQSHQELKDGDILISMTGNVGRVSLCKEGKYLLNQRVGLLQLQAGVNREFVYQALSSRQFELSMISCGQGAAQMNIGKGDIENFAIPYSSNPQNLQHISLILKSYDTLVLTENMRLQLLLGQKQYILSNMFI